jgi:hypothetical protein
MSNKLGLEEALRKLARSRRMKVNQEHVEVRPAHRANANEEFSEPLSVNTLLCVGILVALALIDFVASKWF